MAVFKLLVLFSRCIMLLHALLELIIINNSLCVCVYILCLYLFCGSCYERNFCLLQLLENLAEPCFAVGTQFLMGLSPMGP